MAKKPTDISYQLPTEYVPDENGQTRLINPADFDRVELGIRLASEGAPGVYKVIIPDVSIQPDSAGLSHEPLASFGVLAPGDYRIAARAVMKAGGISAWAEEGTYLKEPEEPPRPKAPIMKGIS